ncbi:mediator of RNA polymerase II transcription subunit 18 [Culicoides brevitarsis]|uniref:mediator of RNA polymerase II transcription subunit 18 n=1 Tax=Culicoides brevitarsis TaxID=469753 RepID=UPI00307C6706
MTQQPSLRAMDSLNDAITAKIVPMQEYLLQGSIMDTSVENLLHRLRGLCDNVESGYEQFSDYEVCFSLRLPNQTAPLALRVRRALDQDVPYQLRYLGQPEGQADRNRPTLVRSCIDIACTASIVEFLNELGFRVEFEYRIAGYMFRKGRMKITVAKIFKPNTPAETISQSYLVELSVLAPSGQEAIAEDMRQFAEQLKPLVQLEKIDHKRLM